MSIIQIDSALLREAEKVAQQQKTSVNQLVESFIRKYVEKASGKSQTSDITPFVRQLGCDLNLPADFDEKKAYRNYLQEKYS